jgi:hypothetical protein
MSTEHAGTEALVAYLREQADAEWASMEASSFGVYDLQALHATRNPAGLTTAPARL